MTRNNLVEMVIRNILLVEKDNRGFRREMAAGASSAIPIVGDSFQALKGDDSGEYFEYSVVHRFFREVTEEGESTDMFDVVGVVIRRPLTWQPI